VIKNITIGQYFPGDSFIHRMDPRVKIIITLIYIVTLFFVNNVAAYTLFGLFTLLLIIISTVPINYFFKGLKPLLIIIFLTAFINLFMTSGTKLFSIGRLTATYEGLRFASFMVLRLIFLVIGTSLLTLTTSPITLTDGIESLLRPFKRIGVPSHELAMMMTIALRFIPTLLEETEKIMKAQKSRGADFGSGNLIKRAKGLVPLLIPLFISAFRRADELAAAMEARCYRGGEGRTKMKKLRITNIDYIAIIAFTVFVILLFVI
jgi:energy-coupling factor transport system permease protein